MGNNLSLSRVLNTIANIKDARNTRDERLVEVTGNGQSSLLYIMGEFTDSFKKPLP